jgi:hypothetical protein
MKLDFIENIEIHKGITPLPNYHSIWHLKEGLFMTYNEMKNLQKNYYEIGFPELSKEQIEIHKKASFSFSGKLNKADSIGMNLIHWYSINLMSYAKCCGLVKFLNMTGVQPERFIEDNNLVKDLRKCQRDYIDSIPELDAIKHFRNKASAHLAYTDPRNDNAGTLVESMSLIPTLNNGKMTIGSLKRGKGDAMSSFGDYEWNLIDNFDSLIPRYFKENFG